MFDITAFKKERLTSGIWKPFSGAEFKIASIRSFAFRNAYAAEQRPYQSKIDRGTLPAETAQELLCRPLAKHVLIDWKNVSANGVEIPYSVESAFKALMANDELLEFVQSVAVDLSNFTEEQEAEEVKP